MTPALEPRNAEQQNEDSEKDHKFIIKDLEEVIQAYSEKLFEKLDQPFCYEINVQPKVLEEP